VTSGRQLSIAIPASIASDIPHLREKTLRIGMIGRSAGIFGVDEIIIYQDLPKRKQAGDTHFIASILSYMETPQYLRKHLFKIRPELRFVGVLPPLRTAHHPLSSHVKDLVVGDFREGVVVSSDKTETFVDVGVRDLVLIRNSTLPVNARVTVKIKRVKKTLEGYSVARDRVRKYWGYVVTPTELTLGKVLRRLSFDLIIATSKYGKPFLDASKSLVKRWKTSAKILVVFGAPLRGLYEIAKHEKISLDNIADFVVNTFPVQEVETVRTEEAIPATLGVLRMFTAKG
jgi:predicted SPOUT superfamily RNA methylase MTH1